MKRFKEFLNEDYKSKSENSKRFQYTIDKNSIEDFEDDLMNNASDMGIENWTIRKVDGVSTINVFLQLYGDDESVNNLIKWIKDRY